MRVVLETDSVFDDSARHANDAPNANAMASSIMANVGRAFLHVEFDHVKIKSSNRCIGKLKDRANGHIFGSIW